MCDIAKYIYVVYKTCVQGKKTIKLMRQSQSSLERINFAERVQTRKVNSGRKTKQKFGIINALYGIEEFKKKKKKDWNIEMFVYKCV